jgi:hypothetical protein
MKTFVKSILFTGVLATIATSSLFAQTTNGGFEQWYRAKFGRPSPTEQARLNSQPVNAASPIATLPLAEESTNSGFEQRYRAKVGRPSPAEEARLKSSQVNPVLPEVTQPTVAVSADGGFEQRYQAKYGRPSPTEEARLDQTLTAEDLSKDQLNALVASAKTPAEHRRIAKFYQSQTQHYLALSKEHETMLAAYKSNPGLTNNKNQASTINHCEYFVQKFNVLAAKSNELAPSHERMATEAAKM